MMIRFFVLTLVYLSYVTELPECLFVQPIVNYWLENDGSSYCSGQTTITYMPMAIESNWYMRIERGFTLGRHHIETK